MMLGFGRPYWSWNGSGDSKTSVQHRSPSPCPPSCTQTPPPLSLGDMEILQCMDPSLCRQRIIRFDGTNNRVLLCNHIEDLQKSWKAGFVAFPVQRAREGWKELAHISNWVLKKLNLVCNDYPTSRLIAKGKDMWLENKTERIRRNMTEPMEKATCDMEQQFVRLF